ncbi:VOC family protein [Halolamina sediminis]|jgi:catechol 2,3-dioxygenase-like lactoylglutathione lyase family enzyme|uniref:VOC family protein n=1 Tax=Halolamina sediminis TaxID=1480675 RepID=UPI0006B48A5A|nr:VOC family protein [Halolamina sediminis]
MRLRSVTLATADPDALRPFYAERLGLPVSDTAEGFVVAVDENRRFSAANQNAKRSGDVGASTVEFRRATADTAPTYHVAFSVPGGSAAAATRWLDARADLLADGDRTQFRYEYLDATAMYALDPAGNVLELLARDGRAGSNDGGEFGPDSLLDVGEIGVVVDDVPRVAAALADVFDVDGSPDAGFAYLGDEAGAFVLAAPGRAWFPTDRPAAPAPLTVVATGGEGAVSFDGGRVTVVGIDR